MNYGSFLYKLGISYFSYGTLFHNGSRKIYGYYFKTDGITDLQKESLLNSEHPVEFMVSQSQYAPEIKKVVVVFLSKAEQKRQNIC